MLRPKRISVSPHPCTKTATEQIPVSSPMNLKLPQHKPAYPHRPPQTGHAEGPIIRTFLHRHQNCHVINQCTPTARPKSPEISAAISQSVG